ncbi:MAG: ferredoxin [candidate division WOR-3 bacterium]
MRVTIDQELCTGCELCVGTCPDLFEIAEETARPKVDIVPEGAEECARQAAEDCPVSAIKLEE